MTTYTNSRFGVSLDEAGYELFTKCLKLFDQAYTKNLAYIGGRGAIIFTPTALTMYGEFNCTSERLKESSPSAYKYMQYILKSRYSAGGAA
jgi:hypothetical protein